MSWLLLLGFISQSPTHQPTPLPFPLTQSHQPLLYPHPSPNQQAPYGYDQRAEVLGLKGMIATDNMYPNTVSAKQGPRGCVYVY
jgi:hypothetical protein